MNRIFKIIINYSKYFWNLSIFVFVLLFLSSESFSKNTIAITLDDCIQKSIENSKTIKISISKLESSAAKQKETDASLLPSLKFNGGYTRLSEVDPFEVNTPYGKMSISAQVFDVFNIRVSASQPIFTGYRLSSISDMMELQTKAAEADYSSDMSKIILDAQSAYWNLYRAKELSKSIKSNIETIKAHLKDIQGFYDAGMALLNDVLKVKVQLANTELLLIDAENAINLATISLNTMMGTEINTEIELKTPIEYNSITLPSMNSLLDTAFALRPELKGMEIRMKAAEENINVAKSGWYPQVFASANYYLNRPNQRIMPTRNEFIGTWDVGITISYDIFNWLTVPYQTEQAQASLNQTQLGLQQLKDVIALEVSQNYLTLNKAMEKINVAKIGDVQAKENVRVTKEKFLSGLATNTDLLDAETASLISDINLITASIEFEISKAKLEKSIGK